ncbi:MAG: 23S rRNA (pseudouridine(1915)-N(3))-methyltransferase RlmH [Oscillospiraceae bacterium]|nr:23S rRNA (pseudouridine(1915)-N(3))-methyltransferase RlmH [Candidatus Equicaccousia limihippi]
MNKINIVAVGKMKEDYYAAAANEYIKRLSPYCKLKITEISPCKLPDNPTQKEIEAALLKEESLILPQIKGTAFCLDIGGKKYTSEDFSREIAAAEEITFVIGGSHGLSDGVKTACRKRISFSDMTFPHRLFRVMLLEQIYRAKQIENGKAYHK